MLNKKIDIFLTIPIPKKYIYYKSTQKIKLSSNYTSIGMKEKNVKNINYYAKFINK